MGKYSKLYSNYIMKKRHQDVDGGTIFERDWGTLGERHVIERGKRRVYADSGFLFTDNTQTGNKFRNNSGPWSDPYTQETLGDNIDTTVNDTSRLDDSNDIRDYAYYGSAVELVRASIENIIKWFPGKFWATDDKITRLNSGEDGWIYLKRIVSDGHHNYAIEYTDNESSCQIFVVKNPFTMDFFTTNATFGSNDNQLRNIPMSFKRYELNGGDILTWDVWIKPYSDCDENYSIKYDIKFNYKDGGARKSGHLYGVVVGKDIVWCTDVSGLNVQPKADVINKYFSGLDGFEAKILNRTSKPEYTTKFITPIPYKNNNPGYLYVERAYAWPHDGYCISVDTIGFENYLSSLYGLANLMDGLWCDNIWRNMTHEAITNFDWTYTKHYEVGQEEENILGGTRMEGILRIWGRCYDDIKRYIDGISLKNCVTYDAGASNLGNAELSDKAELLGWEVYSTKLNKDDNIYLDQQFVDNYIGNWYNTRNVEAVSQNDVDNDFMNRLVLSSGEIFRTKGTKQAIEMAFGLFGIGNNKSPRAYVYVSDVIPQSLMIDDLNVYASIDKISDNVYEFYLPRMHDVTVIVAPKSSTVTLTYTSNDIESVVTECANQPCLIDITNNGLITDLPVGYKVLLYYFQDVAAQRASVQLEVTVNPDFELFERYYSVEPKRRDDIFRHYRPIYLDYDGYDGYVPSQYATFDDYLEALKANPHLLDPENHPAPHIIIDDEYYDLITNITVGEFCENLIYSKSAALLYEGDEFSGTPIRDVYLNNEHYIVPYFTQKQIYDGNVYFESKGGWGKTVDDDYVFDDIKKQEFDYLETIPYMEIAQNVSELLQINMFQIGDKKIFYVMDLSDLSEYIETIPTNISHFFVLKDADHPNNFSSWKNIPGDGYIDPGYTIFDGVTDDDIKMAVYNDKLTLDTIGNNPHCGYASYDMGTEYLDYLEQPFKYPVEHYGFTNVEDRASAAQFMFSVQEYNDEKIANLVNDNQLRYMLPSKLLIIKNNIKSTNYQKYLKEIILKYVLQIIPSTTILMIENKQYKSYYFTTNNPPLSPISINNFVMYVGDKLNPSDMHDATIIVTEESSRAILKYRSNGIESTVTECSTQPCLVDISNTGLIRDLPQGYKALLYYFDNISVDNGSVKIFIE